MGLSEIQKIHRKVVLSTHNQDKVVELRQALMPTGWHFLDAKEAGLVAPRETGSTFEENAAIKAITAMQDTGLWSLADDSGLEVAALNGAPGVQTADFGGWERLLQVMNHLPRAQRNARFVCVLALQRPEFPPLFFHGTCEGEISLSASGGGGFGYDPVFIPLGETSTFASMTKEEKYQFSHRGLALKSLLEWAKSHDAS